jgi:L-rhamnose isomerase/sugar isomerase
MVGAINSNTFQAEGYMLGSLCHPSAEVRARAVAAIIECCHIAATMEAPAVKVWLGDGTNYPGQDDLRHRRHRLVEGLQQVYLELPEHARMYLEYKIFEPAVYSTDVQDWGQALAVCQHVGERAVVCVDTGHHSLGVNIEQIVALLLAEGRLGSFDLNDKKYGDDDLMVGSIDPYQLFRITHELINAMRDESDPGAQRCARETAYMLDQCHNIEPKVPAMIRSVMNLQELFAKALLVDREALLSAQASGDVLEANNQLWAAFSTDVRGPLAELRQERGLPADPFHAYLASGEEEERAAARVGGTPASW